MPSKLHTEDDGQTFFEDGPLENYTYPEDFLNHLRSANNGSNMDDSLYQFQRIVYGLNIFGTPIIIIIGFVGNTVSFIVFTATYLRYQSASMYLAFLNLVDTLFLMCVLVNWFQFIGINLMNQNGICQSMVYLSYVTSFLSVYTVVSFTAERWVIVFKPLRKSTWCTRKHALLVLLSLTTGALILYSFAIWTHKIDGSSRQSCMPSPNYHQLVQFLTSIDTIITLIIPSVVIIVLNISVTIKIWQFVYRRNMGQTSFIPEEASFVKYPLKGSFIGDKKSNTGQFLLKKQPSINRLSTCSVHSRKVLGRYLNTTVCTRNHLQLRTTRALLIVSSCFVVLNFPSHVFRTHVFITYIKDSSYIFPKHVLLWQHICQMLYYANFSLNFFLYSACSRTFRGALKRLYDKVCRRISTNWQKMKVKFEKQPKPAGHRKEENDSQLKELTYSNRPKSID